MTLTPRPYQIAGRDFLAARRFAFLADEMRVGKTPQAIMAAHEVGVDSLIVVCPAIAVPHWGRELGRWYVGPPMSRITVISYDRLRLNADDYLKQQWDLAIVDECHFAKNPEAQRTKLIYGKGGLGYCSDRMWVLSGTPAPKHAGELWCMLKAFGVVKMTYDEFLRRYCRLDSLGVVRGTRVQMIPELRELLAKVMLRRTRKQVAPDMPDIDYQFLEVKPIGDAALSVPAGLSDADLLAWLEAHPNSGEQDRIAVATAKVIPIADNIQFAIENDLLQQTVVFGWHVEPLGRLAAELNGRGIRTGLITGASPPRERERVQRQFREGHLQVVAGNILACGTAIDLSAARHAYFLELDWVSGNNVQAASRLVNMEKLDKVTADVVTWKGSVDDRVQQALVRRVKELSQLY